MNINRNTYESYFLLYVDNELSEKERGEVEAFVRENPDLKPELDMLKDTVLTPDREMTINKDFLLRSENPVKETNYLEYFTQYGDGESTIEEKEYTEQFVYDHPQYQQEFELILAARLVLDNTIVFPDKRSLYRTERERRIIPFQWWKLAVAACLVLIAGGYGWNYLTRPRQPDQVATVQEKPKTTGHEEQSRPHPTDDQNNNPLAQSSKKADIQVAQGSRKINAANTEEKAKTIEESGNIPELANVQHTDTDPAMAETTITPLQGADVDVALAGAITKEKHVVDMAISPEELTLKAVKPQVSPGSLAAAAEEPQVVYIANTSVSKKSSLRGFFRKATRILEKTASIEPLENERGFRIANFEIALR